MVENWRSIGAATDAAIVSGLPAGRFACTWMVGKSITGRSFTGRELYPTAPKMRIPNINSAVMTGLRMKTAVRFTTFPLDAGEFSALPQYRETRAERRDYSCGRIAFRRRRARKALAGHSCST